MVQVSGVLDDSPPHRNEDPAVQSRVRLAAELTLQVAVDDRSDDTRRNGDRRVAVHGGFVTSENVRAHVVLRLQELLLVASRDHQGEAEDRARTKHRDGLHVVVQLLSDDPVAGQAGNDALRALLLAGVLGHLGLHVTNRVLLITRLELAPRPCLALDGARASLAALLHGADILHRRKKLSRLVVRVVLHLAANLPFVAHRFRSARVGDVHLHHRCRARLAAAR
mmetsp:Transcript_6353/g.17762  ORF Transcript_6353/g.17762 Transcript_6353/m.17762 type:complete len:224 (+) Transcript_6353:566-1237(+)